MATLQNVDGRSFVADIGDTIARDFGAFRERRAAQQAQTDLENDLRIAMGGQIEEDPSMGLLGQVSPRMARVVEQLRAGDDPIAQTQFRDQVTQEIALARDIEKLPTFEAKQRRLAQEASRRSAAGEDITRIAQLAQMGEDEFNLELQKMRVVGDSALRAVPEVAQADIFRVLSDPARRDATVRILASNPRLGNMLLQRRDAQIAQERAEAQAKAAAAERRRREAIAARAPKTELGKRVAAIQADINNGNIGADIGNQLLDQVRAEAIAQAPPEFQTDLGKAISDQQLAIQAFGPDSEQAQAFADLVDSDAKGEPPKLSDVAGIRKEYTRQSGDFVQIKNAKNTIDTLASNPESFNTGAGDIGLTYSFMKMFDPTSVVREGEFATAQNAGGVPEQVLIAYNNALEGKFLSPNVRQDFVNAADLVYQSRLNEQQRLVDQYTGIAERANINPADVIVDYIGGTNPGDVITTNEQNETAPARRGGRVREGQEFPEGTIIRNPETGERRELRNGRWVKVDG